MSGLVDYAFRQRLLQFSNLCLGESGVLVEKQMLQLLELLQTLHIGQLIVFESKPL